MQITLGHPNRAECKCYLLKFLNQAAGKRCFCKELSVLKTAILLIRSTAPSEHTGEYPQKSLLLGCL